MLDYITYKLYNLYAMGHNMDIIKINDEYNNVYVFDVFVKELNNALKGIGKNERNNFEKWFVDRLSFLNASSYLKHDFSKRKCEKIEKDLYSLRFISKEKNLRILFTYHDNGTICLLICPFLEKNKSDYTKNIAKAKNRMNIWRKCHE